MRETRQTSQYRLTAQILKNLEASVRPVRSEAEVFAGLSDDSTCRCGHPLYQHDDGKDKCGICDGCESFREAK